MEKQGAPPSVHARADDGVNNVERLPSSSPLLTKQADLVEKNRHQQPRPRRDGASPSSSFEDEKPRYWTKYSSSKLNEPVEGEGLDIEAERRSHEAHERHETLSCLSGHGGGGKIPAAAISPGSGVASAMARLGRESLSMAD